MFFRLQRSFCLKEHHQCCGIKVDFYDQCGHNITHFDHHESCPEREEVCVNLDEAASPKTIMEWALPVNRRPDPVQLECVTLHEFVDIINDSCICCKGGQCYQDTNYYSVRSDPVDEVIPEDVILERRVYWLREQVRTEVKQLQMAMQKFEAKEAAAQVYNQYQTDPQARIFSYDFKGKIGTFLSPVFEEEESWPVVPVCKICLVQTDLRRLPCNCVLDMSCIRSWFQTRKVCPVCNQGFKLIKVPGDREDYRPVWSEVDPSKYPVPEPTASLTMPRFPPRAHVRDKPKDPQPVLRWSPSPYESSTPLPRQGLELVRGGNQETDQNPKEARRGTKTAWYL